MVSNLIIGPISLGSVPSLPYVLGTGCFIAAYSVADGIGARLSRAPLAYTVWMCALWGVLMLLV